MINNDTIWRYRQFRKSGLTTTVSLKLAKDKQRPTPNIPEFNKPFDGKRFVIFPEQYGLRYVGQASCDRGVWTNRAENGWYTNDYGETVCGHVFQLPTNHGKVRFVAGYKLSEYGNNDYVIDFSDIESESVDRNLEDPKQYGAAHAQAGHANNMARRLAEDEREYNASWQAGADYLDKLDDLYKVNRTALTMIASYRENLVDREDLDFILEAREEVKAELSQLKRLGYNKEAFNEGAGRKVL